MAASSAVVAPQPLHQRGPRRMHHPHPRATYRRSKPRYGHKNRGRWQPVQNAAQPAVVTTTTPMLPPPRLPPPTHTTSSTTTTRGEASRARGVHPRTQYPQRHRQQQQHQQALERQRLQLHHAQVHDQARVLPLAAHRAHVAQQHAPQRRPVQAHAQARHPHQRMHAAMVAPLQMVSPAYAHGFLREQQARARRAHQQFARHRYQPFMSFSRVQKALEEHEYTDEDLQAFEDHVFHEMQIEQWYRDDRGPRPRRDHDEARDEGEEDLDSAGSADDADHAADARENNAGGAHGAPRDGPAVAGDDAPEWSRAPPTHEKDVPLQQAELTVGRKVWVWHPDLVGWAPATVAANTDTMVLFEDAVGDRLLPKVFKDGEPPPAVYARG